LNDLSLGVPDKISAFPPQNCHQISPKISDDLFLFLVIDHFNVLMWYFSVGGQIRSRQRYGGGNPYFYANSQCYHYSFCPRGGAKLYCQLRWGAMAGFAPWIRHCS